MKSVQKIDLGLTGYDELFMNDAERKENKLPRIYDIPLSEIDDFPDHGKTVVVENEAGKGFVNQAQTGGIRIEKTSDDGVLKGFTLSSAPFSSAIAARRTSAPSTRNSWNATRSSSRIRSASFGSAGKSRPSPISPKRTTSADGGNTMKMIDDVIIIGIDSGYGNIKTANCCFPASVSAYDKEPVFKENLLVYESKFYLIGEGHKEFLADKTKDLDYYVLALAAIARELNIRKMTCGKVRIAAGLPLTWVSGQRDEFRDYLLQNKAVFLAPRI